MKVEKIVGNIGVLIRDEIQKSMIAKKTIEKEKESFDTLRGIKKAILNLEDLNEVLENRRNFILKNPKKKLNEFFVFGQFVLDFEGDIRTIDKGIKESQVIIPGRAVVENLKCLLKENGNFWLGHSEFAIPKPKSICPICQKELTLDDVNNCVNISDEFYHFDCYQQKQINDEVDCFKKNVIDLVYDLEEYEIKILGNEYCSEDCCIDKPWILLKTPEGDIKMGWNKRRNISIEWQENYMPFNIKELFSIFRIDNGNNRAVFVKNYEDAKLYIQTVRKTVKVTDLKDKQLLLTKFD